MDGGTTAASRTLGMDERGLGSEGATLMGTKNNPGKFDCHANAEPDEPMFILLARDPLAPFLTSLWAKVRLGDYEAAEAVFNRMIRDHLMKYGAEPDVDKAGEAMECASTMFDWYDANRSGTINKIAVVLMDDDGNQVSDSVLCDMRLGPPPKLIKAISLQSHVTADLWVVFFNNLELFRFRVTGVVRYDHVDVPAGEIKLNA